jgi:prevent-host-death family protein
MPPKSTSWSIQDAKDRFSAVVEAARRRPQTVTKHGKPAVVVVAAEEYERLRQLERLKAPRFADHLLAIPKDDGEFERLTAAPRNPGI